MLVKIWIPGTNLGFAYDPYQFTALPTREREFGFVRLESRYDGVTHIIVRKLDPRQLPEDMTRCFQLDREEITRECGKIKVVSQTVSDNLERTVWTGQRRDGGRYVVRQDTDSWIISALGPVGDAIKLGQLADELQKSVRVSKGVQRDALSCPVEIRGTLCSIPGQEYAAILDILIGPAQRDLRLAVIRIEPDLRRQNLTRVIQGRQLLLYSRTLFQGGTNWGSMAIPAGGDAIVQLPRIKVGSNPPTSEGRVIITGLWEDSQPMYEELSLQKLRREVTLAPPVPKNWMAINGPDEVSIHRLAVAVVNGHLFASQRGAIDLYIPKTSQRTNHLDNDLEIELAAFPCFGETVRAPCSGQVIRCRSDLPDQPAGLRDRHNSRGNEICIKRDDGLVVVLAHLRNGSVRVKEGDRVETGQELAQVGNSGQSSEPHLHIHVADSEERIADGVVFRFDPSIGK